MDAKLDEFTQRQLKIRGFRLCARDGCSHVFVKNRKQLFCSKNCRQIELQSRFIEKLGGVPAYSMYRSRGYRRRKKARARIKD